VRFDDRSRKTEEQERIDFENQEEFTFSFELGLAPAKI